MPGIMDAPCPRPHTGGVHDFDLLVIGSGPGGQKAAIAAAKLERRVAIVERPDMLGGVCVNTGTIPSKTMREAVLYLTGLDQREMYGQSYRVKDEITIADLANRTRHVVTRENDVVRSQLTRNRVTVLSGTASFLGPHEVAGGRRRGPGAEGHRRRRGHRDRDQARPPFQRRVRREDGHRLGRHPAPQKGPAHHGGGRRRRDRDRVRVDVRRPGLQGDRGRAARPDAGVLRPRGGRGAQIPPARPRRHVPLRRDRGLGGGQGRRARSLRCAAGSGSPPTP